MICPKCGRVLPDGAQCPCGAVPLSSNPVVNLIKTLGSSPLFLAAAVTYSVAVLLSVLSLSNLGAVWDAAYYYGANYGVSPEIFYPMMDALEGSSVAAAVMGSIPTILVAVGMWLFYGSCRSRVSGNVSTVGLTIIKVIAIISLVVMALCCLVLLALVVFLMGNVAILGAELGSYGYIEPAAATVMVGIALGVIILTLLFMVLWLVQQICVLRTINRVKACAQNGQPDNRVSHYLTVTLMVFGVLGCLGGLIALFGSPVHGIGTLCSNVAAILFSRLLGQYRMKMSMLMYPPVQPAYPAQPPQGEGIQ